MRTQFIVAEGNRQKRKEFYYYIKSNYNLENKYPYTKELFIDSNFPFVIDFKKNIFWVCNSITCLACATQNNRIITVNEFMSIC